jgi:putative endonuclease
MILLDPAAKGQLTVATAKSTGVDGEALARRFLQAKGYEIVASNWRCTGGEIDIVARDGGVLVFVEVKTRRTATAGEALAGITAAKRQRMLTAAYAFAAQTGVIDPPWRIDAIAVIVARDGSSRCHHVENALDW